MSVESVSQGMLFWPVGNGDSTTIVVDDQHVIQIDICDLVAAREDGAPVAAIVDRLVEILPTDEDGNPYLAVFILTHADRDHCLGFQDLLDRVTIGEIWATPKLWREYTEEGKADELCEDAQAFHAEAERRVKAVKDAIGEGHEVASGDRIRVIGYDTDHSKHAYSELPGEYLTYPGQSVTALDGEDMSETFEAFIHAPFKDDCASARNDTSVAMQITLRNGGGAEGHALFFGDLAYETLMKIFDYSETKQRPERLAWDVLLAPHHCSKKVMYVVEEGKETLKEDVVEAISRHASQFAVIVASSAPFPEKDSAGLNPPHLMARNRYAELVDVLPTAEYPDELDSQPIVFGLSEAGLELVEAEEPEQVVKATEVEPSGRGKMLVGAGLLAGFAVAAATASRRARQGSTGLDQVRGAIAATRGDTAAPQQPVGFGLLG